jgi:hypothetical protein
MKQNLHLQVERLAVHRKAQLKKLKNVWLPSNPSPRKQPKLSQKTGTYIPQAALKFSFLPRSHTQKKSTTQSSILNQKNLRKLFLGVTSQKPATQRLAENGQKQNKTKQTTKTEKHLQRIAVDNITELKVESPVRSYEQVTGCLVDNPRCRHR